MGELTDLSKISKKPDIPDKAMGVWQIPDLNVSIPVYSWTLDRYNSQRIVDAENSACHQPYCQANIISDHAGSNGTWYMNRVTLDMQAFFVKKDVTVKYVCYELCKADWHAWGYTINGSMVLPKSSKDIVCASCVDSTGKTVYLALFKEDGKLK